MSKILLINPSYDPSYGGTKAAIVNPVAPTLGLATIAATALEKGNKVEILDMSWRPYDFELVKNKIIQSKPDIVGVTATTPLMNQMRDISVLTKDISENKLTNESITLFIIYQFLLILYLNYQVLLLHLRSSIPRQFH